MDLKPLGLKKPFYQKFEYHPEDSNSLTAFSLQHLEYRDRLALLGEQIFKLANPGELPSGGEGEDVNQVVESVLENILDRISLQSKDDSSMD